MKKYNDQAHRQPKQGEEMPTVKEAIIEYAKKHGYTSIFNSEIQCGCTMDDLMPCGEFNINDCQFGYTKECDPENCQNICWDKSSMRKGDICCTIEKPAG